LKILALTYFAPSTPPRPWVWGVFLHLKFELSHTLHLVHTPSMGMGCFPISENFSTHIIAPSTPPRPWVWGVFLHLKVVALTLLHQVHHPVHGYGVFFNI
jgi:hypothetical protein